MGEVVNLRRARKAMRRQTDATQAAANRVAHGRTRAEVDADRAATARRDALLDGARLDPGAGKDAED